MGKTKTHYRKVFKSDHLGVADLEDLLEEGKKLIFTIKCVKQEIQTKVAGRTGDFNIAYFNEKIKPLVLNSTNSKVIKKFASDSPFVEDWNNLLIELYIDKTVKMKGDVVGGVRIKTYQPRTEKIHLTKELVKPFTNAILYYGQHKDFDGIEKRYQISNDVKKQIKDASEIS